MTGSTAAEADAELVAAWQTLLPLLALKRDDLFDALRRHDLTPPHLLALRSLHAAPRRMRDLAESMACDASWVTAVVDHLEARGLARRQDAVADRRVKEVVLTAAGRRTLADLERRMTTPPAAFGILTSHERRTLRRILAKVVPPYEPFSWVPTRPPGR